MILIYSSIFGSRLYGTQLPDSDTDIKNVHMDTLEDIILKRDRDDINSSTNPNGRNTKDDFDLDSKELRAFVRDCLQGQTYAMDQIFTPKELIKHSTPIWNDLIQYRDKLVTNNVKPFIGYCQGQSRKYSNKGQKLNELIELKNIFDSLTVDHHQPLKDIIEQVSLDLSGFQYVKIYEKFNSSSKVLDGMLMVADSDYPTHRKLSDIMKSINDKIDSYGKRVQLSRVSNGCDYKAFYHAFRVCWELEELLQTGQIAFPSRHVVDLMKVRSQEMTREDVESWLTDEIERVLKIPNNLPKADETFWNSWILDVYLKQQNQL